MEMDLSHCQKFSVSQTVKAPIKEVFGFFSNHLNLELITPPFLNFSVKSISSEKISQGTEILYRLKIHGVPVGWRTKIILWNPSNEFIDFQLKGPYVVWHHHHRFTDLGSATLMEDEVSYKIPGGILGQKILGKFILKDITRIFDYRRSKIEEFFS